jgi:hypothetical protein
MTPLQIRLTFTNRNNVNKENTKQTKKSTRVLFDWRTRHSIGHNVSSAARGNWQRHLTRLFVFNKVERKKKKKEIKRNESQ